MFARGLLLSAAVAAALPVVADMSRTGPPPEGRPSPEDAAPVEPLYFTDVDIDAMLRAPVVGRDGKVVGSVAEVAVAATGRITGAIVRVSGGELGVTGTRITVAMDHLRLRETGHSGRETYVLQDRRPRAQVLAGTSAQG